MYDVPGTIQHADDKNIGQSIKILARMQHHYNLVGKTGNNK